MIKWNLINKIPFRDLQGVRNLRDADAEHIQF